MTSGKTPPPRAQGNAMTWIDNSSRWLTPSDVGRRDVEAVGDVHSNLSVQGLGCGSPVGGANR